MRPVRSVPSRFASAVAVVSAVVAVAPAAAPAASQLYPGTTFKDDDVKGGTVKVSVAAGKKGLVGEVAAKRVKTKCGRQSLGGSERIKHDSLSWRVSDMEVVGELEVDRIEVDFAGSGREATGTVKVQFKELNARRRYVTTCSSGKLRFKAPLVASKQLTPWDAGHYVGSSGEGWPLSFDLTFDSESWTARVENLAFTYEADCRDANDEYQRLTVRVSGVSHQVTRSIDFDARADGVDYSFYGGIEPGWLAMGPSSAEIDVSGGYPNQYPDPDGPGAGYCWQDVFTTYNASRQD